LNQECKPRNSFRIGLMAERPMEINRIPTAKVGAARFMEFHENLMELFIGAIYI
jgi:hypothetical protein